MSDWNTIRLISLVGSLILILPAARAMMRGSRSKLLHLMLWLGIVVALAAGYQFFHGDRFDERPVPRPSPGAETVAA